MKKRIAAIICMAILGMGTLTVYADDMDTAPRAVSCGACRGGSLFEEHAYPEIPAAYGKCEHGLFGYDIAYEVRHQVRLSCNNKSCGMATEWEYVGSFYRIQCLAGNE